MLLKQRQVKRYFSYQLNPNADISKVALVISDGKGQTKMLILYSAITSFLSYKFEDEDSFPVTVLVNGKELMTYAVEVEE